MKTRLISFLKKGATLIELTIVMAIVAILSTVIVSYAVAVRNYSRAHSEIYNSYSDFDCVRLGFQKWLAHFDSGDYALSYSEDRDRLISTRTSNSSITYSLAFNYEQNLFVGYYPENVGNVEYEKIVYYFGPTSTVIEVSFDIFTETGFDGCLVECEVTYETYNLGGTVKSSKKIEFLQNMYIAERLQ